MYVGGRGRWRPDFRLPEGRGSRGFNTLPLFSVALVHRSYIDILYNDDQENSQSRVESRESFSPSLVQF